MEEELKVRHIVAGVVLGVVAILATVVSETNNRVDALESLLAVETIAHSWTALTKNDVTCDATGECQFKMKLPKQWADAIAPAETSAGVLGTASSGVTTNSDITHEGTGWNGTRWVFAAGVLFGCGVSIVFRALATATLRRP